MLASYGKSTIESLIYHIDTIKTLGYAISSYIPFRKIRANNYFLKPKDEEYNIAEKWNMYTEQSVNVIEISGEHFSTLKSPHIITVTNEMKKILDTTLFS